MQATRDTRYLDAGAAIIQALFQLNWVEGGWASIHSVHSTQLEDHMPSYFLAEACKYLFLLFDDSFLQVLDHSQSFKALQLSLIHTTSFAPGAGPPLGHVLHTLASCKGQAEQKTQCLQAF